MVDAINGLIASVMGSPWAYLAIFLVCVVDAFFPVVPSETTVIAGGVSAAAGGQNLSAVLVLGALGAFLGDHVSYGIGRRLGPRAVDRLFRGERGRAARQWTGRNLRVRGGLVIVVARFIPGGRTATTLVAGTLVYPFGRFSGFAALGAVLWAAYGSLIGYFAGGVFRGNHLFAVAVGVTISVFISVVVETARFVLRRYASGVLHSGPRDR